MKATIQWKRVFFFCVHHFQWLHPIEEHLSYYKNLKCKKPIENQILQGKQRTMLQIKEQENCYIRASDCKLLAPCIDNGVMYCLDELIAFPIYHAMLIIPVPMQYNFIAFETTPY